MSIQQGKVEFHFGVSDGMVDALKQQTREYIESIREEIPENQRLQMAAAIYDISHTESSRNYSGLKKAGVAFSVFPEEAIPSVNFVNAQLQKLQFTEMRAVGTLSVGYYSGFYRTHLISFGESSKINRKSGAFKQVRFENGVFKRFDRQRMGNH